MAGTVLVSKVKGGLLELTALVGGAGAGTALDYACQVTSASIEPGTDTGTTTDKTYTLCDAEIPTSGGSSGNGYSDKLNFTVVSDHNVANGIIAFSWAHRGEPVLWKFIPAKNPDEAGAAATTWQGVATCQPLTVGGEVRGDLRISGSWDILSLTPPAAFGTGYPPAADTAYPGATYTDKRITASDAANATTLNNLAEYIAIPKTAWKPTEKITIGGFAFHWTGTAWKEGAAP